MFWFATITQWTITELDIVYKYYLQITYIYYNYIKIILLRYSMYEIGWRKNISIII